MKKILQNHNSYIFIITLCLTMICWIFLFVQLISSHLLSPAQKAIPAFQSIANSNFQNTPDKNTVCSLLKTYDSDIRLVSCHHQKIYLFWKPFYSIWFLIRLLPYIPFMASAPLSPVGHLIAEHHLHQCPHPSVADFFPMSTSRLIADICSHRFYRYLIRILIIHQTSVIFHAVALIFHHILDFLYLYGI